LAKRAFLKLEHAILAGACFETGATERALTLFLTGFPFKTSTCQIAINIEIIKLELDA
jgi:hypothetical protein